MCIPHRHAQRGMTQDLFERNDVPSPHDEVSGEGMAQDMARLPLGWLDRGFEQHLAEDADAVAEWAMLTPVLVD